MYWLILACAWLALNVIVLYLAIKAWPKIADDAVGLNDEQDPITKEIQRFNPPIGYWQDQDWRE